MTLGRTLQQLACAGGFVGAALLAPPTPAALRELAAWLVRPALLPFAWQSLGEATRSGDAAEVFARAQQILHLLPSWTDGHAVFAYRFALEGGGTAADADRGAAAHRRLQIALAWLDGARAQAGRREVELLQTMAFLPEVAAAEEPALFARLAPEGGPTAIADHLLAEAERLSGSPAVREQRTFLAPRLCAGLLAAGDPGRALAVLDVAIARSADVRDRDLATEWRTRLEEVRRHLRGEPTDLAAVRADLRMAPLVPHLR